MTGIVDLLEAIKNSDSGPTEAARAIRKKLYVNPHFTSHARALH